MSDTTKDKVLQYSIGEEIANAITHGIGAALSVAGAAILVTLAIIKGNIWHLVSFTIFGISLFLLYLASTLYHSIPRRSLKRLLKTIDHCAIFLLIAGTYTPFLLISLRGVWGWSLFGVIWGITLLGIVLKIVFIHKFQKTSLALYIMMGWLIVIASRQVIANIEPMGIILIAAGGLSYMLGVPFYVWKKLPYNHAIWHIFVLGGSVFHYFAVLTVL